VAIIIAANFGMAEADPEAQDRRDFRAIYDHRTLDPSQVPSVDTPVGGAQYRSAGAPTGGR